ncbi:methyltransferase-like protein 13 [Momordica charantia]|uniref:spermidine synthase n=1 Tax=Momordica charantia TaxID=3673 RepID=A0A6J1CBG5_MOMCH|nr:methyltransferase-like protein 13 [Momordica charantia]
MDTIQKDLSPLVKQLAPEAENHDEQIQISFMMASDGIRQRTILNQVTSSITGQVKVEDVMYEKIRGDASCFLPTEAPIFRRLIFQRTESLVQSEALLIKEQGSPEKVAKVSEQLKVDHGYLASFYHMGIISGFTLVSEHLETATSARNTVNAVVVGLGAGLLPMFLHASMPFLDIDVVELDPVILGLAKEHFDFTEDEHLKVHIADGVQFLKEVKSSPTEAASAINGLKTKRIDILIIDVDSFDTSSGMICPAADFLEESFLQTAKDVLSEQGLFVVNLVTQSPAINDTVISKMQAVFGQIFGLQLEEDGNEVLFALPSTVAVNEDCLSQATVQKFLEFKYPEIGHIIVDTVMKIRPLS